MKQDILNIINKESKYYKYKDFDDFFMHDNPLIFIIKHAHNILNDEQFDFLFHYTNLDKIKHTKHDLLKIVDEFKYPLNQKQYDKLLADEILHIIKSNSTYEYKNIYDVNEQNLNTLMFLFHYKLSYSKQPNHKHFDLLLRKIDLTHTDNEGFTVGAYYHYYKKLKKFLLEESQIEKLNKTLIYIKDDVLNDSEKKLYQRYDVLFDTELGLMKELNTIKNKILISGELDTKNPTYKKIKI